MISNTKQELHALIDQLSDGDAAETLAYARQLLGNTYPRLIRPQIDAPRRPHAVPTLHRGTAIGRIDELQTPLFAPEESVEDFNATVQRWREKPEGV